MFRESTTLRVASVGTLFLDLESLEGACESAFYIIIFQNKLKIVEITKKIIMHQNKTSMAKAMDSSEIHIPLLSSPGPIEFQYSIFRLRKFV
jgi:hypothetical protein